MINCLSPNRFRCLLQYAQGGDNVLRVVLSAMYSSGWVGMAFSKDGLMVGSSAMVGWVGKKGQAHVKQFALNGKAPSMVVADRGFLVSNGHAHTVLVKQAKIYLAFQLNFDSQLKKQQVLFAFGSAIPVNDRLAEHQGKTSSTRGHGGARRRGTPAVSLVCFWTCALGLSTVARVRLMSTRRTDDPKG